jgi:hypothetical protein
MKVFAVKHKFRDASTEEEAVAWRFENEHHNQDQRDSKRSRAVSLPAPNRTGMPDHLKAGIEALSGLSLDSVHVHYNSTKPAELDALAYAQGTDIHISPGQEKHLPHEAWHVVQQAQGRVTPTAQLRNGDLANDDATLECEADAMGNLADQKTAATTVGFPFNRRESIQFNETAPAMQFVKIKLKVLDGFTISDEEWSNRVRTLELSGNQANVGDGQYNFVVQDTSIYIANVIGHSIIARGKPVEYAGRLLIKDGEIVEWNNESGHYMPEESLNDQALLPLDMFRTWEHYQLDGWDALKPKAMANNKEMIDTTKFRPVELELESQEEPRRQRDGQRVRPKVCPGCNIQ